MSTKKQQMQGLGETVIVPVDWSVRIARFVSRISSPPIIAVVAIMLSALAIDSRSPWFWIVAYVTLSVVPPTLYIFWLVRKGEITDFHLIEREQRTKPLIVVLVNTMLVCGIMYLAGVPKLMLIMTGIVFVQVFLILLITLRWKISGHCTAAAGLSLLAIILFGAQAIPLFIIVPVIAWSRIHINRHSFAQTIAGCLLGAITVVPLLLFSNLY